MCCKLFLLNRDICLVSTFFRRDGGKGREVQGSGGVHLVSGMVHGVLPGKSLRRFVSEP